MINELDMRAMNPWWDSPDKIDQDPKITEWEESSIKYDPRIRDEIDYSGDVVYSLRGSRQVGKTTLVKLQIRDLLQRNISPLNILYYTFDLHNSPRDIVDTVQMHLKISGQSKKREKHSFLFLDEISSVKDWQKGIKWLWDQGYLQNCVVMVTGSHTIDIKKSTERLPGRRGRTENPYDNILLPMTFSEYISVTDSNLYKLIREKWLSDQSSKYRVFKNLMNGEIDSNLHQLSFSLDKINFCFSRYMLTGGIPRVVNEYKIHNMIKSDTFSEYLDILLAQLHDVDKESTILKGIVDNMLSTIPWPTSWNKLWKNTDIGSINTARDYILTLQDMFILNIFYQYNTETKRGMISKEKKIHFQDPFFLHVLNNWNSIGDIFSSTISYVEQSINQGQIVEGIVGSHLVQLAFKLSQNKQMFDPSNYVYTWRHKSKEVDFVLAAEPNMELPIEVKYQNKINRNDLTGIYNFRKETSDTIGLLLTKENLRSVQNCVMVPTSLFLLLV